MTDDPQIPLAVTELIETRIHSIEELEVVLSLEAAGESRTALELATALRMPETLTVSALESLTARGLVAQTEREKRVTYTLAPEPAGAPQAVKELVDCYREMRFEIIMLISRNAISRVRTGALRMFSDSFRVTGPKKDG